ncbi:MAG TPA: ATP-binding protein [Acidobacteriaceae bacterium]
MLPTSHRAPRNSAGAGLREPLAPGEPLHREAPAHEARGDANLLASAFSEFIAAAGRLEASYGELQEQVAELSRELAQRNAALNASLAENEGMRLRLQQIVDSMPCGVLVLERDGALARINPEGMRLLAIGRAESRNLATISAAAGINLTRLVEDTSLLESEQELSLRVGGVKRWIEIRTRRIYAAGDCFQTILILRDVTAHKLAEEERERGRRATALAEIAAILAHEIRNPLASMELFAGLLASSESVGASGGAEQTWISHMRAGIRSLSGTVNNVLNVHGGECPALARLDVAKAVESSVQFAGPIAAQAGVRLVFAGSFDGAGATEILGNASALQQVVLNLVTNAVRHTAPGGEVRVTVGRAPGDERARMQLEVTDTGSGIAPEHLPEIFRAGFSVGGNTSGLGLAVCRQIVSQHDGELYVASTVGQGTRFCVEIPTL